MEGALPLGGRGPLRAARSVLYLLALPPTTRLHGRPLLACLGRVAAGLIETLIGELADALLLAARSVAGGASSRPLLGRYADP